MQPLKFQNREPSQVVLRAINNCALRGQPTRQAGIGVDTLVGQLRLSVCAAALVAAEGAGDACDDRGGQ